VLSPAVDVEQVPVLAHIAKSGATILDLGTAHGLRKVVARRGEQFMLLEVAPDGRAVVAGLQSDLPVATLLAIAGHQVTELGTAHGLRALFVRNGQQFQVLYVTPDGERVIPGVMWDGTGKNITREQATPIAGAFPTAVIGGNPGDGSAAVTKVALEVVEGTSAGTIGSETAPRLWVFADPLCGFSVRALRELRPFVASGRVQVAVIPVSVLDPDGNGKSTAAALSMLSRPAGEMVAAWSRGELNGSSSAEAAARLRANMAAADRIGLRGTPTVIWRKADGSEGRLDGLASDWNAVIASMEGASHAAAR
jgi:thiol:disulfide interchange protein DsbG